LTSNGRPWLRPLYVLPKYHLPLYEKLREDRLVPDDLDAVVSTFTQRYDHQSQPLYTFNDAFIVNFSFSKVCLSVITEQGMEVLRLSGPFFELRDGIRNLKPYTGSALARFERSTLPEHKGTRTVVLRILKIITPVKCVIPLYDGHIAPPEERELHRRYPRNLKITAKLDPPVWSVDIDRKCVMARALQLLWDT